MLIGDSMIPRNQGGQRTMDAVLDTPEDGLEANIPTTHLATSTTFGTLGFRLPIIKAPVVHRLRTDLLMEFKLEQPIFSIRTLQTTQITVR